MSSLGPSPCPAHATHLHNSVVLSVGCCCTAAAHGAGLRVLYEQTAPAAQHSTQQSTAQHVWYDTNKGEHQESQSPCCNEPFLPIYHEMLSGSSSAHLRAHRLAQTREDPRAAAIYCRLLPLPKQHRPHLQVKKRGLPSCTQGNKLHTVNRHILRWHTLLRHSLQHLSHPTLNGRCVCRLTAESLHVLRHTQAAQSSFCSTQQQPSSLPLCTSISGAA